MSVIDLRSDTVTRPTVPMREAMLAAPVGDDVFGDDPSVLALETRVATLLGKEAAIYVPSGVMANQIAVRLHVNPGEEAIVHSGCHIYNYEGGAAAALSGVSLRPLPSADGSLDPAEVRANLHGAADPHLAVTRMIAFENTHNACGGVIVPQGNILDVAAIAREHGLAMHLDGARLMNAVVASGVPALELAAPFDTISLCLSKGLGAPVGSVLAGPKSAILRARRFRKLFGGGMRQSGILAAAGLHALDHHVARLAHDHRRARHLAEAIAAIPGLVCDLASVQTNLVFFDIAPDHPRMVVPTVARTQLIAELRDRGVLLAGGPYRLRAVTHLDVHDAGLEQAIAALKAVMA
jgi:threonine aldolase